MTDEISIVKSVIDGNPDGFGLLIDRYQKKVFAIVAKRIPPCDMESVAHDVFLRAYNSLNLFSMKKPFENWLSGIAMRTCCDYWRSNGRRRSAVAPELTENQTEWLESVSASASLADAQSSSDRKDAEELLEIVMASMEPEDRLLIDMLYLEDWPLKEASDALGWGLSKTKVRAMRAKMKMRKILNRIYDGEGL